MPWYAPQGFISPAPARPVRLFLITLAALAAVFFVLASLNPGGLLPGIAAEARSGDDVTLTFKEGDRYFWITNTPANDLAISQVVAQLQGEQAVTQRANYQSLDRQAYREGGSDEDFPVQPNYLYEVRGVFHDGEVTFRATGEASGKDFLADVQANSNVFLKRLWFQIQSIPSVVWDDILHVKDDIAGLFSGDTKQTAAAEPVNDFIRVLQDKWFLLAGLGLLIVLAPLLGIGPLFTGLMGALVLGSGGTWPFYVMAGICAVIGFMLDENAGNAALRSVAFKGMVAFGDVSSAYPRTWQGALVFLAGLGISIGLAYFGHVDLMAVVLLLTGAAGIYVMSRRRGENADREGLLVSGIALVPGVMIALLGIINGVILLLLGYVGFSMAFFVLTTIVGYAVVARNIQDARRAEASFEAEAGFREKGPGERYQTRIANKAKKFYGGLETSAKLAYAVVLIFMYLSITAAGRGDWLTFASHLVIGVGALVATFFVGRFITERRETKEAT